MIIKTGNLLEADELYIAHQVNNLGVMGAGLALQIKHKYPQVFIQYRNEYRTKQLGDIQCISVNNHIFINMFSQQGISRYHRTTDYQAFEQALLKVQQLTQDSKSIALPYNIGCGLAGGDWNIISKLIDKYLPYAVIYKL